MGAEMQAQVSDNTRNSEQSKGTVGALTRKGESGGGESRIPGTRDRKAFGDSGKTRKDVDYLLSESHIESTKEERKGEQECGERCANRTCSWNK